MKYQMLIGPDELPTISSADGRFVAQALTKRNGELIVEELNRLSGALRERLLDAVTDAIENCFEGT